MMTRVKIFSSFTEEALEMKINDYLALNKCKVLDVKYQVVAVDSQIFNYATLIIGVMTDLSDATTYKRVDTVVVTGSVS